MKNITNYFINELEARFGTEEALGICFLDESGKRYTLAEGDLLFKNNPDNPPHLTSIFQNGDSATCCTNYARYIRNNLKQDVKIYGFKNEDNPTAKIVRDHMHPGGHDFVFLDDRFLVDPWIKLVTMKINRVVFDMDNFVDLSYISIMYGPKSKWKHMVEAEY